MATGEPFFHVTGEQINARVSQGAGEVPIVAGAAALTANLSAINGATAIQLGNAGAYGFGQLIYEGWENSPTAITNSIVYRVRFNTYPAATVQGLFSSGGPFRLFINQYQLSINGAQQMTMNATNATGQVCLTSNIYTWAPTTGVWYDMCVTWDGTTTANAVKFYIDAVNVANFTATRVLPNPVPFRAFLCLGGGENINNTDSWCDEFAWYNTVIDPTSVTFRDSTTGSLNGASRTKYLLSTPYTGPAATGGGRVIKGL